MPGQATNNGFEKYSLIPQRHKFCLGQTQMQIMQSHVVDKLFDDSRSLWVPRQIQEYQSKPSSIPFLRDHAGQSLPCVWRGAALKWRALQYWTDPGFRYLRHKVGHKQIKVALTPDGRADAILRVHQEDRKVGKVFAMPWEKHVTFSELLDTLVDVPAQHPRMGCIAAMESTKTLPGYVSYYSAQDGNLLQDVPELMNDLDEEALSFAKTAFGAEASAVNIWVGDGRSLTTMHADPFENLYLVVAGVKVFELRAPCDAAMLPKPSLRRARWIAEEAGEKGEGVRPVMPFRGWRVKLEDGETAWVDEDIVDARWGACVEVELHAGDLLYLPGLWCK